MRKKLIYKIIASFLLATVLIGSVTLADSNKAVVINVHGEINEALTSYLDREIKQAEKDGADVIILDIDTWGGFIMSAEKINNILTETQIPTIAYISKKAVSAGVMVTISCDKVAMAPGTHSGAAETIPYNEKTLSAWVGMLTSAAESTGRPVNVVKAMADKREVIEGLSKEGELLNITANHALQYGYCDVISLSHEDALSAFGYEGYEITTAEYSNADKVARFLTGSTMLSILFYAGVFFMILEMFTAGFGLFGIISIICFVLYFFGGVIAGYTEWWAVALFVLGIVALAIEFTIPGFGVFGAVGIVLILLGLMFSAKTLHEFLVRAGITMLICIISIPIMIKLFGKLKLFDKIVNKSVETTEGGYIVPTKERTDILGMTGMTMTPLRPSGMATINDKRFDVLSIEGFVDSGVTIKVIETSGNRIIVKSVEKSVE